VHFRKLMLSEIKKKNAEAANKPASYRLRSGGAVLPSGLSFEEVMKKRFGSVSGKVT